MYYTDIHFVVLDFGRISIFRGGSSGISIDGEITISGPELVFGDKDFAPIVDTVEYVPFNHVTHSLEDALALAGIMVRNDEILTKAKLNNLQETKRQLKELSR